MKILVINGANLNMLGVREPEIYGKDTYKTLVKFIKDGAKKEGVKVCFFQSNEEGKIVTAIQKAYKKFDGIAINPGAYTHTSVAILDALKAVGIPAVEVHISDPDSREEFRRVSYIRSFCIATVKGKGKDGYLDAIKILKKELSD
ncbi:MAG: 3-dehydroquinate dehydratase [Clostridia bacterium]|nr:3-dehydroquinate dehydratase [Clostridia bacterium]